MVLSTLVISVPNYNAYEMICERYPEKDIRNITPNPTHPAVLPV